MTINHFEKLRLLMQEAVESDLVQVSVLPGGANNIRAQETEVERLKQEIFKGYLIQTEDFRESIYQTDSTPEEPPESEGSPGDTNSEQPGGTGDSGSQQPGGADSEQPGGTGSQQPEGTGDSGSQQPGNTGSQQPEQPDTGTDKKNTTPKLLLCRVTSAKTSHTLRWNSVKSADGYEIYGAESNGTYKRLRTVSKKSDTWKHKKLKKGKSYKYYVTAYQKAGGKKIVLAKSLPVYSMAAGGTYGNPSKITAKKTYVSVKSGKKVRLHVQVTGKKLSKTGKKVRYVSSNPAVAKVSGQGVITGKKRGSCTVYCIARNGLYKKVKVKVNNK